MKPADLVLIAMIALGSEMVLAGDLEAKLEQSRGAQAVAQAAIAQPAADAHLSKTALRPRHHHRHRHAHTS